MDNTPQFTEQNAENIKNLFMQKTVKKRGLGMRVFLIAAVLALFTTSVIAAGLYWNSFDNLREILGEEEAAGLQPVGIINAAGEFVRTETTRSGIHMELVAIGVHDNTVDIFLTLEDLIGSRLDGDISIWPSLRLAGDMHSNSAFISSETINRTSDGVVTIHSRRVFPYAITGRELRFEITGIGYNYRHGEYEIAMDLSTLTEQTPAAQIWDTPILAPHQHNITISPEGFENLGETTISSIGLINGRLHIQIYQDSRAMNRRFSEMDTTINLISPYGEIIPATESTSYNTATISFGIAEDGDFYNDSGHNWFTFPYVEQVFDVDLQRLAEYRIIAALHTADSIESRWVSLFTVYGSYVDSEVIIADGLDILREDDFDDFIIREIRLSPFSLEIIGSHVTEGLNGLSTAWFESAKVHKADGAVVELIIGWAGGCMVTGEIRMVLIVESDPLVLEDVVGVEVDGYMVGI